MTTPPPVRLSVGVMHHEARPECLARLLDDLEDEGWRVDDPYGVDVVYDPEPYAPTNPWRCARLAWQRTPAWCTHRLVLQDDAMPCHHFRYAVHAAILAKPQAGLSFYMGEFGTNSHTFMKVAAASCLHWSAYHAGDWIHTVALVLPRAWALDLGEYTPHQETRPIADDQVVGEWVYARGHTMLQSIPALVQHDADAPSTVRGNPMGGASRVAACWIGDYDARTIDWSKGP